MPVATTELELKLLHTLKRIAGYEMPEKLRRISEREYGCDADEAIEMAYENVIWEAKAAIKGIRLRVKK